MIAAFFDTDHLRDGSDVDHQFGLHQPHVEQRPEGLAAGQRFRGDVFAAEQRQGSAELTRPLVIEARRFHAATPALSACFVLAAAIASSTRRGVIGET